MRRRSATSRQAHRRRDDDGCQGRVGQDPRSRLGATSSSTAIASAPTTPGQLRLGPAASATGVREELLLIGNPWKKPARGWRRRGRPSPGSGRPASAGAPHRCARARWYRRTTPARPRRRPSGLARGCRRRRSEVLASATLVAEDRARRCRERAARSKIATAIVAAATAIRMPGTRGSALQDESTRACRRRPRTPRGSSRPAITCSTMPHACRIGPSAETLKPRSFGIWLSITVSAMPFM